MKKYVLISLLLLLLAACLPRIDTPNIEIHEQIIIETVEADIKLDTASPECLSSEMSVIGKNIAGQFKDTSFEQIMTWFCNGAEFEDILIALQTEKVTDQPAHGLLEMLVAGLTWDEIWQTIGYIND